MKTPQQTAFHNHLKNLIFLVCGVPFIPAAILLYLKVWPASFIIRLQIKWFGFYGIKFTLIGTWIILMFVFVLPASLLALILKKSIKPT